MLDELLIVLDDGLLWVRVVVNTVVVYEVTEVLILDVGSNFHSLLVILL
jgi:hypothetical protein